MNRDKSIPIDPPAGMTWRFRARSDTDVFALVNGGGDRQLGELQLWDAAALKRHLKKLRQKRAHDYGWHEGTLEIRPVYREDEVRKLSRDMVRSHQATQRRRAADESAIDRLKRAIQERWR